MLHRIIILFLFFSHLFSNAQTKGKIAGKIEDAGTSEELIGVAVGIKGSSAGVTTDIEGHYSLSLDSGTYTIVISYVGYKTKEITDVVVKSGEITSLNMTLEEAVTELEEVVVTATYKNESVDALMLERKNAVSVSDGMSADLIKKTPDRNTSDIIKRVSGAAIQDNKFAIIRGLNERYNTAYLNNVPLPSSEPDRKAFAFDIFPSNLVESMTIYKTASPDLPGDFAGGVIKIKTRDFPDENFVNLSLGLRYNAITTFKDGLAYKGGKTDWLGIDDGTRKLSSDFPTSEALEVGKYPTGTADDKKDVIDNLGYTNRRVGAQSFANNWALNKVKLAPGTNMQLNVARKINNFGIIFSLSYLRNIRFVDIQTVKEHTLTGTNFSYADKQYNDDVMWGGLLNLAYKINQNHKITVKNTYNINSTDQTVYRTGREIANADVEKRRYNTNFTQNRLQTIQLGGDHFIKYGKVKVDWVAGLSDIRRLMPDYKILTYTYQNLQSDPSQMGYVYKPDQSDPRNAGRFFSDMKENVKSLGADASVPLPTIGVVKTEVKVGGFLQERYRAFDARQFVFNTHPGFNPSRQYDSLTTLSADHVLDPGNFDYQFNYIDPKDVVYSVDDDGNLIKTDKNGNPLPPTWQGRYTLEEATKKSDSYKAGSSLRAFYFMLDNRVTEYVRVNWGMRYESFQQRLNTFQPGSDNTVNLLTEKNDWLPSVNFTVSPHKKVNVRLSYSKTLNRPEFRELAPFQFFDFSINRMITGNIDLRRATIQNYDARVEFFPGAGQVVSLTYFRKDFTDPIEKYLEPAGSTLVISVHNAKSAFANGFEFDFRQNLQFIRPTNKYFQRLTMSGNLSLISSNTKAQGAIAQIAEADRPLQGQSNYILNGGLTYDNPDKGFALSFMANRVGRRIAFVGYTDVPSIWENPRTILDFQVAKSFLKSKRLEAKLNIGDILAQPQVFYQDVDKDKKFTKDTDKEWFRYKYGTNASLTLAYKF